MSKLRTTLTTGAASLGLVVGLASFAGATSGTSGSITDTGPGSLNVVRHKTYSRVEVENNNNVNATNNNGQNASSGKAGVYHNTTGGAAKSGNASNANSLNASLTVDNSASSAAKVAMPASSTNSGTIKTTGPGSRNIVKVTTVSKVEVKNNNNLNMTNNNSQNATSGNATVAGNTTGGSATSGNATNTNSTTMSFKVTN